MSTVINKIACRQTTDLLYITMSVQIQPTHADSDTRLILVNLVADHVDGRLVELAAADWPIKKGSIFDSIPKYERLQMCVSASQKRE